MKVYDLAKYVNPVKAACEAGMASALGNDKSGGPVFFNTWAPNRTIFKLKPGKDVMWINVPKIHPKKSQKDVENHVNEWIAKNSAKWNGWLDQPRKAAQ